MVIEINKSNRGNNCRVHSSGKASRMEKSHLNLMKHGLCPWTRSCLEVNRDVPGMSKEEYYWSREGVAFKQKW
jgi:hypothetical protein